jgi:uncharacterized protein (DUF58 family)
VITRRGWAVIGASLGAVLLTSITLNFLLLQAALVVLAFVATDVLGFHLWIPRVSPDDFTVERTPVPPRAAAGVVVGVATDVTYLGVRKFWGEIYDVVPASCPVISGSPALARMWSPGDSVRLEYTLRIGQRGRLAVGPIVAVAVGPLGLSFNSAVLHEPTEFLSVPPPPTRLPGSSAFAMGLRTGGGGQLRQRGYGSEVRALRPYQPSDDIRHIAWRRSTRKKLLVREFLLEVRRDYLLAFDVTPSMGAGTAGATPLDSAARAGRMILDLVERGSEDRIGFLSYGQGIVDYLAPGRGAPHSSALEERLALLAPSSGEFNMRGLCWEIGEKLNYHTQIFLFSTVEGPLAGTRSGVRHLARRGHRLVVFTPEIARFYLSPTRSLATPSDHWARQFEGERLVRHLGELRAGGVGSIRCGPRDMMEKVLTAYRQDRIWGRGT